MSFTTHAMSPEAVMQVFREYARRVNPGIDVLQLSATRGDGMDAWLDWLRTR